MLLPCSGCRRHVRANERVCPFCAAAIAPSDAVEVDFPRVSRAQLIALAMAMSSCAPAATEATVASAPTPTPATSTSTSVAPAPSVAPSVAPPIAPAPTNTNVTVAPTIPPYYPGVSAYGAPGAAYGAPPGNPAQVEPKPTVAITTNAAAPHKDQIMKAGARFRACAQKAAKYDTTYSATVTIAMTIEVDGTVKSPTVTVVGTTVPELKTCIESAARAIKFSQPTSPVPVVTKLVITPK